MRRIPFQSHYLCFITTVTKNRRRYFNSVVLAERLATMIRMACRLKRFVPLAYAIMPDHVHLLVCTKTHVERTLESMRSNGGGSDDGGCYNHRGLNSNCGNATIINIPETIEGALSSAPDPEIAQLMKSIKGTFSRTMPKGKIWQRRYFCWYVSDPADANRIIEYIRYNYVKTNLPNQYGREPFVRVDRELNEKIIG